MEKEGNNDWLCRNCNLRFVPTYWVSGGPTLTCTPDMMVGQCPKCGSNATHQLKEKETTS